MHTSTKALSGGWRADGAELAESSLALIPSAGMMRKSAVSRSRRVSVLSIGLPEDRVIDGLKITHATEPRAVIEMLRVMDFSVLLVSAKAQDVATWNMLQIVRRHWPRLRWVLLTDDCTDQEEILARSLGAASVTNSVDVILELAANRRSKGN